MRYITETPPLFAAGVISLYNDFMSSAFRLLRDNPLGLWKLDDTSPFDDYSGYGRAGTATGTPGTYIPLTTGVTASRVFTSTAVGQFESPVFRQGLEDQPFTLEATIKVISKGDAVGDVGEQQILGHSGQTDGLAINGTVVSFTTKYLNSLESRAEYDVQERRTMHLAAVHTENKNSLYIDGELVAEADILNEYVTYEGSQTDLFVGATTSTQGLAVNTVAIFDYSLSADVIREHARESLRHVSNEAVATAYGGIRIPMAPDSASIFLTARWDSSDWPDGEWAGVFPLDAADSTSIYGVNMTWDGSATVEASLDGEAWSPVYQNKNLDLIPNGFDPTDKDLFIRVTAAEELNWLEVHGYSAPEVASIGGRTITLTPPAYLEQQAEAADLNDDWGVELRGGTITLSPDPLVDTFVPKTIEIWGKGAFSTNLTTATPIYSNGGSQYTPLAGEWQVRAYVVSAGLTGDITITGADAQIGQVVLYPDVLTATQVSNIYKAYTGIPTITASDISTIAITKEPASALIYAHDWSITAAG